MIRPISFQWTPKVTQLTVREKKKQYLKSVNLQIEKIKLNRNNEGLNENFKI